MIVVDTNVIAYLYLPSEHTKFVEKLLEREPSWAAPVLWRSEFRNVLATYLRKTLLTFEQAIATQMEAEALMAEHEFELGSFEVLQLVKASECSAYDCEFVALAKQLNAPLVTVDKKLLKAFPRDCVSLAQAIS